MRLANTRPSSSNTRVVRAGHEVEVLVRDPHHGGIDLDGVDPRVGQDLLQRPRQRAAAQADDQDALRRRIEVQRRHHHLRVVEHQAVAIRERHAGLPAGRLPPELHAANAVVLVDDDVAVERALGVQLDRRTRASPRTPARPASTPRRRKPHGVGSRNSDGHEPQDERNRHQSQQDRVDLEQEDEIERGDERTRRAAERRDEIERSGRSSAGVQIGDHQAHRVGRHRAGDRRRHEEQQRRREERPVAGVVDPVEDRVERGIAEQHHGQRREPGRDQQQRRGGARLGECTEKLAAERDSPPPARA